MDTTTDLIPLRRVLNAYGLPAVSGELATLALRPHTQTCTHIAHAERHLRGWRRGEPDRLEHAIARLLWCALALRLKPEAREP